MNIATHDRLFCYIWSEDDTECKFGQRFVKAGLDAQKDCESRVRSSLGVRKDIFPYILERGVEILDCSEIAKNNDMFHNKAKVDDFIRKTIGFRKNKTGEVHTIPQESMSIKVNEYLISHGQPLIEADLSSAQYDTAVDVIKSIESGKKTIMAELAARFGKTIWSSAVATETEQELVIVSSYVKTVFTSFANDIVRFDQFRDYVHVDTSDRDYEAKIEKAFSEGKKVFAYLSMCNGSKRQGRIDYLFGLDKKRMLVIDEADFGSHKEGQSILLQSARKEEDVVLIMTGTNSDRAVSTWKVDHITSVVYAELLAHKAEALASETLGLQSDNSLSKFKKNTARDTLYPSVACYQMPLIGITQKAVDNGVMEDLLPSWTKFVADPIKASGFFTYMLQAIFEGKHSSEELSVKLQTRDSSRRVAMMFLPGNTKKTSMADVLNIAETALGDFEVVMLNGSTTTNRESEKKVKEVLETSNKNVLIISASMAQRSFSIPEITELYLAYDNGSNGATIQKISRALTANGKNNKVGKIFSLSFDPNRDDKFDALVLEAALNLQEKNGGDIKDHMATILKSIDIFSCTENGPEKFEVASFVEQALSRNSVSRVLGNAADISKLTGAISSALANGNVSISALDQVDAAIKGKTKNKTPFDKVFDAVKNDKDPNKKDIAKVREMLVTIVENVDFIIISTETTNIKQALEVVVEWNEQSQVERQFNVPFEVIQFVFENDVINQNFVDIKMAL